MAEGSIRKISAFYDGGSIPDAWGTGIGTLGGGWSYVSVNEGSFTLVQDEPGGLLSVTLDTADNDNWAAISGPFKAADGTVVVEARFKMATLTDSAFVGLSETMNICTPVMPAEFATTTMTYNGCGAIAGFQFDADGTTDTWRAVVGDGSAVKTCSGVGANGTATDQGAPVADEFDLFRIELHPSGRIDLIHCGSTIISGASGLNVCDVVHGVVMFEARSACGVGPFEIDYMYAEGERDWTV